MGSRADPGFDPGRSIMGFTLRNGISFCRVGDRIIFLDIVADRYFCLSPEAEHSFRALVEGGTPPPDDAHVQGLLARGVLMTSAAQQAPVACRPIVMPLTSVLDLDLPQPALAGTTSALCYLATTRVRLKMAGLGQTLSWLSTRKSRLPTSPALPEGQVERIMAGFVSAARIASQIDLCLANSIAVASRMIAKGIRPDVVLGVQLGPFSAHCWVQHGDQLVNDRVDMVRTFTPILVL
ncbi:lasso peptide biosynthesis B2 protein [Novosphingobium sp. BW1]|uniref:lasso peptide biosynthesis B2 protein n=1 Tax=Novosphingobium sp. BW1 TaxID=2592621 RepID=UPI0011DECAF1|nr:lasso peptide biosynthesis B2 protein [Novosphingobium sp. BW1]TYC98005.1 lasso peptide biosynthesis B2 protein [Novosphingobium sp. BW1]